MTVQSLHRVKKIVMTNNVLPLHFVPSQASSSQNSNVDSCLQYSLKPSKSESSLPKQAFSSFLKMNSYLVLYSILCKNLMRRDNFVLRYIILIFELEKTILALQIILFPPELEYRKNTFLKQ